MDHPPHPPHLLDGRDHGKHEPHGTAPRLGMVSGPQHGPKLRCEELRVFE